MIVLNILYGLFIAPLELLFEFFYSAAFKIIGHPGPPIVFLSLAVNFLALPLYRRADLIQAKQREKESNLKKWTEHIKKTFHGDEKYMMLQTYYRQNGHKPTDSLRGSFSLLLEIPFFIAAYHFLSNLQLLKQVKLWVFEDLGKPDHLLPIAGHDLNLFPIVMTLINLLSATIYMEGFPGKDKVQTYGMALIFLVLLYSSPSGLVFYWTLNNLFSLSKNALYKAREKELAKEKAKEEPGQSAEKRIRKKQKKEKVTKKPDVALFFYCTLLLAVLSGLLIPSTVISSSVAEFMSVKELRSPVWMIFYAVLYAVGTFVIWLGVFYRLAGDRGKKWFEGIVWLVSCAAVVNHMFFGTNYGFLSNLLVYNVAPKISRSMIFRNLGVLLAVCLVAYLLYRKRPSAVRFLAGCAILVLTLMSVFHIVGIQKDAAQLKKNSAGLEKEEDIHFQLSKTGKNVVVLMLDRGIGELVSYIMKEKPELQEKFAGFTWYPNTISYGQNTLIGSPALYGGYEYTPENINTRSELYQKDKQNEALKLMPVLFDKNNYEVTVCDPTYANFQWIPDLSIYDEYPDIKTYITMGNISIDGFYDAASLQKRNFFCFSIFRIVPQFMQSYFYDRGKYHNVDAGKAMQTVSSNTKAEGLADSFLKPYVVLSKLPGLTQITSDETNTFLMMSNDTTHEPVLLKEPEYEPAEQIDNTALEAPNAKRESLDGEQIFLTDEHDMISYHANMASLLKLADWFDYMRENDVYDNTRIIIVSDHGYDVKALYKIKRGVDDDIGAARFNPIFMVKDFGSKEFQVDEQFMTNADTPTLAFKDLISSPINPFTGNAVDNKAKEGEQHISHSSLWMLEVNNRKTLLPCDWYSFTPGDVYDSKNWKKIAENVVSP